MLDLSFSSQSQEGDLRCGPDPSRNSQCPEPAIDIQKCRTIGRAAKKFGHLRHRQLVQARYKAGHEPCRTPRVLEDFYVDLAAVGVACETQLDAESGSAVEGIWVVRKQYVNHVLADKRFDAAQRGQYRPGQMDVALVVDADQVKVLAIPIELGGRVPKQFHAVILKEGFGRVFGVRIDFVVAITSPHA